MLFNGCHHDVLHIRVCDDVGHSYSVGEWCVCAPAACGHNHFRSLGVVEDADGDVALWRVLLEGFRRLDAVLDCGVDRARSVSQSRSLHVVLSGAGKTKISNCFGRTIYSIWILSLDGIDNFFSDNYFDILPRESRTIHVTTSLPHDAFRQQLKTITLGDTYDSSTPATTSGSNELSRPAGTVKPLGSA